MLAHIIDPFFHLRCLAVVIVRLLPTMHRKQLLVLGCYQLHTDLLSLCVLTDTFEAIAQMLNQADTSMARSEECKVCCIDCNHSESMLL